MTTDARPAAPAGYNPLSDEFLTDPHTFWQTKREHPVFYYEPMQCWVFCRHEDVSAAVKDWQTFSSNTLRTITLPPESRARVPVETQEILAKLIDDSITNIDPGEHTVHRKNLQKAFTRPVVAASEPHLRELANELIDGFVAEGHCDLLSRFCHPFTLGVITGMIGLPPETLPRFRTWIYDMLGLITLVSGAEDGSESEAPLPASLEELEARYLRVGEAYPLFRDYLNQRRATPQDDLASAMVQAKGDDGGPAMSDDHILSHVIGLVIAGTETTANLIGQMVRHFTANPDVLAQVRANPALWPNAVEEGLRRSAIANNLMRVTTRDVEVGGVTIPARSKVLLNLAGANSDDLVFADPLAFDLHRANADDHLGFGAGRHFCAGAPLARLELTCALQELYRRIPDLAADLGQQLEFEPSLFSRMVKELNVTWTV